ncbi:hypothetical protein CYMTET_13800 [Cymbomonas tetramitiformis]|uniref:Uncharacterized protein n=1 Tax=Cymbomonas tetramitiformis TaxID=36881 RepID=A0AAE0GHR3_9CHLO|nr:hypothetical protein CYMTET_13800 [Cymbomonas tetramitiformis]
MSDAVSARINYAAIPLMTQVNCPGCRALVNAPVDRPILCPFCKFGISNFFCEYECGFSGNYAAVVAHEEVCPRNRTLFVCGVSFGACIMCPQAQESGPNSTSESSCRSEDSGQMSHLQNHALEAASIPSEQVVSQGTVEGTTTPESTSSTAEHAYVASTAAGSTVPDSAIRKAVLSPAVDIAARNTAQSTTSLLDSSRGQAMHAVATGTVVEKSSKFPKIPRLALEKLRT